MAATTNQIGARTPRPPPARPGFADALRRLKASDAYLVAENSIGTPPVGVVRKDGNVWRILRFEIPADQQPSEVFATRREAGARLTELASPA